MKKIIKAFAFSAAAAAAVGLSALSASAQQENASLTEPAVTSAAVQDIQTAGTSVSPAASAEQTTETQVSLTVSPSETASPVTEISQKNDTVQNGWNNIDGKWYYFNGENFLTGTAQIDGSYYIFAYNGTLKTGWQTVKNKRLFYSSEDHCPVYGWLEYMGNTYFCDKEKGKVSGMQKIGEKIYIFSEQGILQHGPTAFNGYFYYCGEDGSVYFGDQDRTPVTIGSDSYLINPKGHILCGWQLVNSKRYWYSPKTGTLTFGWLTDYLGGTYYSDRENGKYTGDMVIDSHVYRFESNGRLCTGQQGFDLGDGITAYYYFYKDGSYAVNQFITENGSTYYFDSNSVRAEGWLDIANSRYYFDKNGVMATGSAVIDGSKYYFDKDGRMQTGLLNINGKKYLFGNDGKMQFGFQTASGKTYYFDTNSGAAQTGWKNISGKKYWFDSGCVMAVGFKYLDGDTYYFDSSGQMLTGWQTIKSKKYYFGKDGKMYTYRHNIGGKNYLFYWNGVLASGGNNTIIELALTQLGNEGGRKFWTWWGSSSRFEWCACFVSWCAAQCGYTANNNAPQFISCKVGINWFKSNGQWRTKTSYTPKSGDFVFFDWEGDGIADHVGLVDVMDGEILRTVEGNSSDMVRKKEYEYNSKYIFGYACTHFPDEQ